MLGECQSYAALIALDPRDEKVFVASENCGPILGASTSVLLNTQLGVVLGPEIMHALRNAAALPLFSGQPMALGRFEISGRWFDSSAFRSGSLCVIEIEPAYQGYQDLSVEKAMDAVEYLSRMIEAAEAPERLLADVAGYLRYLSGYAHVRVRAMAAELEANWPTLPPHEDIEVFASIVYSVSEVHAPLRAAVGQGASLALSSSYTRAVNQADRALAAESGAVALINVPLRVSGRPWGLLSFESPTPKSPSPALRQILACITPHLCRKLEALESATAGS